MSYSLTGARIFTGSEILENHALIIKGEHIHAIVEQSQVDPSLPVHDFSGCLISAGFIDLQLNGCGGVMFNGAISEQTLDIMHQANIRSGTTTFLPTLVTSSCDEMDHALAVSKEYQQRYPMRMPGLHLEGPFISKAKKGIHTEAFIRPLTQADIEHLLQHRAQIAMLTIAPENVMPEQIQQLASSGIRVSVGHSNGSYEKTKAAFNAGAGYATHIYNAMSGLKGRDLGVLGAIFDSDDVYAGIIVDGLHMDFASVRIAKRQLGEHLYLVTDATAAANSNVEQFEFVGRTIRVEDGLCVGDDGTLGGSSLTMNEAVRHCVQNVGLSQLEALRMATLYPARAINMDHMIGRVRQHYYADLVILNDHYQVSAVVNGGQLITL
ncbi:N-acetylglucosamine-6-phosphate deacetylase [Celerinatantimonas yamalensis]|uniref:N-acetylglucosamine-6-phosphate deacetylase n=1 Tax=Celerinatantimonas yamalensis TaxID=559956 RepID=A0ABW9G4I0_9GAMM